MSAHTANKVLVLGGGLDVRGSVTYTLNLVKGLKERECETLVVCSGGNMLPAFQNAGIRVDQADNLGKPVYDLFAFRRYIRSIAAEGFKLIHVQHKAQLRYGIRAARALKLPIVLTIHHFFEPGETLRVSKKYVRGIIAVSQAVREDLVNNARIPRELVRVVSTGIDLSMAASICTRKNSGRIPVIGTIGMLTDIRGNEYFLKAAREVLDRGQEAHFVVAGQGPQNARLRKQAKELDLLRNVTFVTDFNDNYEVLQALDIFVNPSLREGLGLTVLQAMACGIPTVSTASGGIHSFVIDGETGLMVPQKDHAAIAMGIIRLLEDREFAHKIAANSSKMVEKEYPLSRMMDEVLDLYDEVVKEWNSPANI